MCECYKIGGPFIDVDPNCPVHGPGGLNEQMQEQADTITTFRAENERLQGLVEFWIKDSAIAWDKCEERRKENEKLRAALQKADNALTQFVAFEDDCRAIMGNTNFRILKACQTEVRAALAEEKK